MFEDQSKACDTDDVLQLFSESLFPGVLENLTDFLRNNNGLLLSQGLMEEIAASLKNFPESMRSAVKAFGDEGWYPSWLMTTRQIVEGHQLLLERGSPVFNESIANYFESKLDVIEHSITEENAARSDAVSEAFWAHRSARYYLSIPVFLAQAEGIWTERMDTEANGSSLFGSKNQQPKPLRVIRKLHPNGVQALLLHAFTGLHEINCNDRSSTKGLLNRHGVLHGRTSNYGTRLNSLKSISLLHLIAGIRNDETPEDSPIELENR